MHRFTFSKSLICATLGIISMPSIAALQPASEAALAGETTKTCHFNQDTGLCRDKAKIRTFVLQDIELKGNLLSS